MNKNQSDFRKIIKGTAIFGGTQLITMLTNIVRGKLVAMILGSYGMGIQALIQSIAQPITQFFTFGIPMASVSSIANTTDADEVARKVVACRRCVLVLALLSVVFTLSFSPLISMWTFKGGAVNSEQLAVNSEQLTVNSEQPITYNPQLWVMLTSIAIMFMIMTSGEIGILQSVRSLKRLAWCNIIGPVCSLIIGIPIYYIFGVEGIVPSLIIQTLVIWMFTRWHTHRLSISIPQAWSETFRIGKSIMVLGGTMMLSGLLLNITTYIINTFVNTYGNTTYVGLYQGAANITLQCVSLVFTAFATDYYPHLTQVSHDRKKTTTLVNQEGEIVIFIMAIVVATLTVFAPLIVRLVLTSEFLCIIPVIQVMSLAFLLRAFYFPLGYIVYAKGDKLFYLVISGLILNAKYVFVSILMYKEYGILGLGYAFALSETIDLAVVTLYIKWKYAVFYSPKMIAITATLLTACIAILLAHTYATTTTMRYAITTPLLVAVIAYSTISINKRINIMSLIKDKLNKNHP